ncbi:MAG: hypothetical protein AAFP86_15170, partial [Planctomycetota bacterium]
MKLAARTAAVLAAGAALFTASPDARAGEVEISMRGEVTLNLTGFPPSKGSEAIVRFRVRTPGVVVGPGDIEEYEIVPESWSVRMVGVGESSVDGPDRLLVENGPTADSLVIPISTNVGTYVRARFDVDPSTFGSTDLEQQAGVHPSIPFASFGGILGNGVLIDYSFHTLVISEPSAGVHFCEPAPPNLSGYPTYLSGSFTGPASGLHLDATNGPPDQFGFVVVGPAAVDPGVPLGRGELCIASVGPVGLGRYSAGALSSLGQFNFNGQFVNQSGTSTTGFGFDVPPFLPYVGAPPELEVPRLPGQHGR